MVNGAIRGGLKVVGMRGWWWRERMGGRQIAIGRWGLEGIFWRGKGEVNLLLDELVGHSKFASHVLPLQDHHIQQSHN